MCKKIKKKKILLEIFMVFENGDLKNHPIYFRTLIKSCLLYENVIKYVLAIPNRKTSIISFQFVIIMIIVFYNQNYGYNFYKFVII